MDQDQPTNEFALHVMLSMLWSMEFEKESEGQLWFACKIPGGLNLDAELASDSLC
jgi:hypothetical protein